MSCDMIDCNLNAINGDGIEFPNQNVTNFTSFDAKKEDVIHHLLHLVTNCQDIIYCR